jgi:hypothetical protein
MTSNAIQERLKVEKWHRDCFLGRFPRDSSLEYLLKETTATLLGGVVDASNVVQYGFFHICSDPKLAQALRDEVDSVWPSSNDLNPETAALQKLPLLVSSNPSLTYMPYISANQSHNLDRCNP